MLKFAESQFERIGRSVVVDEINLKRFLDKNPRLEATQEMDLFEFDSVDMFPFKNAAITVPKGTIFRMMQCDIPDSEYVVCDIVGEDSPEEKYYWVQLAKTVRK